MITHDTMQSITLSGGPIAYRHKGQGPALLLLHGWGGSSRYWLDTLEQLSDQRSIYAIDLPGYGASPPWDSPYSLQKAAAFIIEFADALGIESFEVNGHSLSSSVAVHIAVTIPTRVRRLVLTCASTYRNEFERGIVRLIHHWIGLWVRIRRPWMGRIRWLYRAANRRFFYRVPTDNDLLRLSFEEFLRMDQRTAIAHAIDAIRGDYHATLRQISVPTLLIGARQDSVMPTAGTHYMTRLIPNCRVQWIEECGHLPMIERPDCYNQMLRAFLLSDSHNYQPEQETQRFVL